MNRRQSFIVVTFGIGLLAAAAVGTGYWEADLWVSHGGAFLLGAWFVVTVLELYHR